MHVEDHPLEYADFEGDIPARPVRRRLRRAVDRGTYELVRERPDGTLTVILHGGKLEGEWALVPAKLDGEERNWLIVRASKDAAAGPQRAYEPMLPREAKRVPTGADWAFEIAWDGVRALAPMEGTRGALPARRRRRARRAHQAVARRACPARVRTSDCVLDGVICSFEEGVVYVVTDLLDLEGASLIDLPWCDRRTRLDGPARRPRGRGASLARLRRRPALRTAARAQGLGVVAKRRKSPYRPGVVSDDWRLLQP